MEADPKDGKILLLCLRSLLGWNQQRLVAAARVSRMTISRYENGKSFPSNQVLDRLAEASGIPRWVLDQVLLPAIAVARGFAEGAQGAQDPKRGVAPRSGGAAPQAPTFAAAVALRAEAALADLDLRLGQLAAAAGTATAEPAPVLAPPAVAKSSGAAGRARQRAAPPRPGVAQSRRRPAGGPAGGPGADARRRH